MTSLPHCLLRKSIVEVLLNHPAVEYTSISSMALDHFADALAQYIERTGRLCTDLAEHSGRTLVTFHDILMFLKENRIFVHHLEEFFEDIKNATIHPIQLELDDTPLPYRTETKEKPESFLELMKLDQPEPFPAYIPDYMPPFPERHNYKLTPIFQHRESDPVRMREHSTRQNRLLQENLKHLIQKRDNTLVDIIPTISKQDEVLPRKRRRSQDEIEKKKPEEDVRFPTIHYSLANK